MEIIKKYGWLPVVGLVVLTGVFFFFYRMYNNDVKALTDFSNSYEKFDEAISAFSASSTNNLERKVYDTLVELATKSTFRISSLIKNDGEIMSAEIEIAILSRKEFSALGLYQGAIQSKSADLGRLAKEYNDLTSKRKAAYARFRELAEM